jgi:cephalosporin hydroxylase
LDRATAIVIASKYAFHSSWYIKENKGIGQMQSVPLMAWMNYYHREIHATNSTWMGYPALKCPTDIWVYQEIIFEVKPDVIIEIGNRFGGSTLFLASMLDLLGKGEVVGVDIDHSVFQPSHDRFHLITGDSANDDVISQVRSKCEGKRVMLVHDGIHTRDGVLTDLRNYSEFISPGSYFIVEDGIIGVTGYIGGGEAASLAGNFLVPRLDTPLQAIEQFIAENDEFEIDKSREKYILTDNPNGYLRRREKTPAA